MSTSRNNIVREVAPKSLFASALPVLSSAVTFNQGDFLAFNTSSKILKTAGTADIANLLGIAQQKVVSGIIPSPYQGTAVDASQGIVDMAGPVFGVVASMVLNNGDTFHPGDKVYLTTDPQTVTVTDPSTGGLHCGIFQGSQITAGSASMGPVLIGARFNLAGFSV